MFPLFNATEKASHREHPAEEAGHKPVHPGLLRPRITMALNTSVSFLFCLKACLFLCTKHISGASNLFEQVFYILHINFLLFIYTCLHFSPTHPRLPPSILTPHWLFLYMCSRMTAPLLSPLFLPSGYCHFVLYFNVFGYILLACLFC